MLDLVASPDPSLYDLCPHHADALVVPNGWERVDDRTVQEIMVEPSADDRAEEAARRRSIASAPRSRERDAATPRQLMGAGSGGNRYAGLVAQLPRLAAEVGVPGATHEPTTIGPGRVRPPAPGLAAAEEPPGSATPVPPSAPDPDVDVARSPAPVPSRDLAPLPPREAEWAQPPLPSERPQSGQLAIPVDDLTGDTDGVVLQFETAGARRRTPRS